MKNLTPLLVLVALIGFATSCSNPNSQLIADAPLISQKFTDAYGRAQVLTHSPDRVVSLAANITEIIYAIGAEKRLAAVSHDSNYPQKANSLPYVITFPEFDLPSVAGHNPDLVLASTEFHDNRISEYFDRYKIPLHFQDYKQLKDIYNGIRSIGRMLSVEAKANQLADSLTAITQSIADSTAGQIKYPTAMILGIDPITIVGGGSFMNDMIEKAGGKNVFASLPGKYLTVTPEEFVKAAPEYVLVVSTNDKAWNNLVAVHPEMYTNIPAAEKNHIFQVEPELVVTPGPRIVEGLMMLTRILHPRVAVDQ